MSESFAYLEGKRFCVVFVQIPEDNPEKVRLQRLFGRACVDKNSVSCVTEQQVKFTIPASAMGNILPSDGTDILLDAEYYVLVKADPKIDMSPNPKKFVAEDESL